jgi:hypothetical protein
MEDYLSTRKRPELRKKIISLRFSNPKLRNLNLTANIPYQAAIGRVYYWTRPGALPDKSDPTAMGIYWKKHWNSPLGKGKALIATEHYEAFVLRA